MTGAAISGPGTMRRPREGRVVLGVCAAIARRTSLDVTLVRVLAAVGAALLTTPFIVAYAAAALILPRDDGRMLIGGQPPDRRESIIGWLVVIPAAVLLIATPGIFGLGAHLGGLQFLILVAGALLIALSVSRSEGNVDAARTVADPAPAEEPTAATAVIDPPPPPAAETAETEVRQRPTVPPPPPASRSPKPDRGPSILPPALAALIGLFGLAAVLVSVFDIGITAVSVAVFTGVLAVACCAAAFVAWGRRGTIPLLVIGALLASVASVATIGRSEFDRGIGYRNPQPQTVAEVESGYEMGIGYLEVDLRDLRLPPGETTMPVHVGFGAADIKVPAGLKVVSAGEDSVGGEIAPRGPSPKPAQAAENTSGKAARGGKGQADAVKPEAPVLVVDGDVGAGTIEINRPGGGG